LNMRRMKKGDEGGGSGLSQNIVKSKKKSQSDHIEYRDAIQEKKTQLVTKGVKTRRVHPRRAALRIKSTGKRIFRAQDCRGSKGPGREMSRELRRAVRVNVRRNARSSSETVSSKATAHIPNRRIVQIAMKKRFAWQKQAKNSVSPVKEEKQANQKDTSRSTGDIMLSWEIKGGDRLFS